MNKKEKEKIILKKFIEAYQINIDSHSSITIIDNESAKKVFPKYTGENPDFVILINNNYIAVELFELIRDNIEDFNINNNEKKKDIVNAAHLHSRRKESNDHSLYLMEDLAIAALDRINDKVKNKLNNYINCPIWLIGYATEVYNMFLLSPYFEDGNENFVALYISQHVIIDERITAIWLAEFSNKYLLLKIR
jgi:hypothetical protein